MDELRIHLLGGFRVSVGTHEIADNEWRLRKAKALVKVLALAPGHQLHRDQVVDQLWPDLSLDAAANQFRKALHDRQTDRAGNRATYPSPPHRAHHRRDPPTP
jgi:DNA-binding SARP family transcriptional activator